MKKITVLDFCNQIGAASDEIPVVVKAGMQEIRRTVFFFIILKHSLLYAVVIHP